MNRIAAFVYGSTSYVIFLVTFLYAIGFVGNFAVPKSMDSPAAGPWTTALTIDLVLLSLFAIQHSVMARPGFKRVLTRVIPPVVERSTYVLASSLALLLLFWQWRPLGGVIWDVQNPIGRTLLYGGFAFGWGLVLFTTFVINHFDLFGLRQVWRHLQGKPQSALRFVTPWLYRIVRHPLYVGWFLRILEHSDDDGDAPGLRADDDGLHSRRDPTRRARSDEGAPGIRDVPRAGADARAVHGPAGAAKSPPPGRRNAGLIRRGEGCPLRSFGTSVSGTPQRASSAEVSLLNPSQGA
jgi:protein-S-isoprenylcysteine O-methyltransferase Ste14